MLSPRAVAALFVFAGLVGAASGGVIAARIELAAVERRAEWLEARVVVRQRGLATTRAAAALERETAWTSTMAYGVVGLPAPPTDTPERMQERLVELLDAHSLPITQYLCYPPPARWRR